MSGYVHRNSSVLVGNGSVRRVRHQCVFKCVAMYGIVLQWVAEGCSVLQCEQCSDTCTEISACSWAMAVSGALHTNPHKCVAVCCSVLHCVAVCCSVLQCVAVYCAVLQCEQCSDTCVGTGNVRCVAVRSSVLQCVTVCRSALQYVGNGSVRYVMPKSSQVCCIMWQSIAVRCTVLQCVAVCCSPLYCVAVCRSLLQSGFLQLLCVARCVAMCCNVLHCVAVCCSPLQCVAV